MKKPKKSNFKNMDNDIFPIKTAIIEENQTSGRETAMAITVPVENRNGFAFAIAEVKSRSVFAKAVMEIIRDRMTRLADTIQESASLPRRFEQTLDAINEEIAARASETEVFNPADLNAVIGLAVDKTIYLSGSGELPTIFLHKLPEGKYQVFNLARSIQNEQAAAGWQKIFVVVLDGDLKAGDVFCACNKNLQREMPPEELHALLAVLPPQGAAVKLRQYFPLETNLSLFILRVGGDEERAPISAPASLKQLHTSREQTKRVLADQKPSFFGTAARLAGPVIKNRRLWWRLAKTLWRLFASSIKIIVFIIRDIGFGSFKLIRRLFSSERKELFKEVGLGTRRAVGLITGQTKKIPKTSRYLILAALAMIVIIVFSVITVSKGREDRETRAAFEASVTKVEALQDAAESALIYKDENKAKNLLTQAEQALDKIAVSNEENQNRIDSVREELTAITYKLRRVTEIENPEVVENFESDILSDEALKTKIKAVTDIEWVDQYIYGDRIYLLSPNQGLSSQIYRLAFSGDEFGTPTAWIKSPIAELSDTVSLAVDGTVFVLRSNGKVLRFVGGRDVAWTQGITEPALTSATDIWTSSESSYIYILDPAGQRLMIFEKESGNLKIQYHSAGFDNLVDFVIDETNKIIYLLGNENVYKIEAEHLK